MRGLACVLMFQTHCYDAWLGGAARNTGFLKGSQILGTLPAPLFLFLAGISFALVTDKLIRKGVSTGEITRAMLRHGAEIFAFGLLFRLQEFLIAWGWAPWSDLLRVDVLNIIGLSMMLMALLCGAVLQVWGRGSIRNDSYQGMPSGIPQMQRRQSRLQALQPCSWVPLSRDFCEKWGFDFCPRPYILRQDAETSRFVSGHALRA